jgi:release factor glutamine methyltransferase
MSVVPFMGLELETHPDVYRPAEDTALLLKALAALDVGPGDLACDVGTGTGAAGLAMARRGARVIGVDVNPRAVRLARANAARNAIAGFEAVQGSLLAGLKGPFDLVTFNPPYLPVEGEMPGDLAKAWEGGPGGIAWARLFLAGLHRTLAPGGRAVVLMSSLGARGAFDALVAERGLEAEVVATEPLAFETLEALRVQRGNL